jgi:hypothetical protein
MANFPPEIYTLSPDTNLYAFMRSILGDSGVNLIAKQYYEARQTLEEMGLDLTNLDAFFSNPLGFLRNPEEVYSPPSSPVIFQDESQIRSQDASFFSRAVNYIKGARAGNTPLGMQLVASAGLGQGVEIIENYKWLFDQHSDNPLGIPYFGQTLSPQEFIVLPLPEFSQQITLEVSIGGNPTGGTIGFYWGRANQPSVLANDGSWTTAAPATQVPFNASSTQLTQYLEWVPGIGNTLVTGGPGPQYPWYISRDQSIQGDIDLDSIQLLNIYNNLTGENPVIYVNTLYGSLEANEQTININSEDTYYMLDALDNIRPVNSIVTVYPNSSIYTRTLWNNISATSEYAEVVRFVTGNSTISWPSSLAKFWIQSSTEVQAPRIYKDLQYNYQGFHNISSITASTVGVSVDTTQTNSIQIYNPTGALADFPEPLFVTASEENESGVVGIGAYINSIYPIEYADAPGAPTIIYTQTSWQSQPGSGQDWLEIDLGEAQACNYISFDVGINPLQIDIFYDTYDDLGDRNYVQVSPILPYNNVLGPNLSAQPFASIELAFCNSLSQIVFARRLLVVFTRLAGYTGNVTVQNLRIARNIS